MENLKLISGFIELGLAGVAIAALVVLIFFILREHKSERIEYRQERNEYRKEREELREAFQDESKKSKEQHEKALAVLDKYTDIISDINRKR